MSGQANGQAAAAHEKKKSGGWICVCVFFFFYCRLLYIDTPKRSAAFHERSKRKRRAIFYKSPCPAQS